MEFDTRHKPSRRYITADLMAFLPFVNQRFPSALSTTVGAEELALHCHGVKSIPSLLLHHAMFCSGRILGLHVTSLPPCWWTITKYSSLPSIVSSTNMAATSLLFDSREIDCKSRIACLDTALNSLLPSYPHSSARLIFGEQNEYISSSTDF